MKVSTNSGPDVPDNKPRWSIVKTFGDPPVGSMEIDARDLATAVAIGVQIKTRKMDWNNVEESKDQIGRKVDFLIELIGDI